MTKPLIATALAFLLVSVNAQNGTIEAEQVTADSLKGIHIGDGSRLFGLQSQNLSVSETGDTLHISEGNWVIIPGISASNSGTAFANAGPDIVNACETSFNLPASPPASGSSGQWEITSGVGGNLVNPTLHNALFVGQEGESYILEWTVNHPGGSSSFDQVNISIAVNIQTSIADAGDDLFAISTQSIILNGNVPQMGSNGKWEIIDGIGGIISNMADPMTQFTGVAGETYLLRWQHFNDCSTSSDELTLTFSPSASGVPSANGRYFVPDPKFRQYLQIAYPSVMDGDSLIIAMGDQVDKVRITNLNVVNLDGLQYLTAFSVLNANRNHNLKAIPFFSESMIKFSCDDCNQLEIIPAFPMYLDTITGRQWQMTSLPNFPAGLQYIRLDFCQFSSSIPDFPPQLKHLELYNFPSLVTLPSLPESCEFVSLSSLGQNCCPSDLIVTLNIPSNATEFHVQDFLSTFPNLPADKTNLERLTIGNSNISDMPSLYDFTNLNEIYLGYNALLQLDSLPFALQYIQVDGNPLICVKNKPPLVADQLSQYDICPTN